MTDSGIIPKLWTAYKKDYVEGHGLNAEQVSDIKNSYYSGAVALFIMLDNSKDKLGKEQLDMMIKMDAFKHLQMLKVRKEMDSKNFN